MREEPSLNARKLLKNADKDWKISIASCHEHASTFLWQAIDFHNERSRFRTVIQKILRRAPIVAF
jgi:hypothetical protein